MSPGGPVKGYPELVWVLFLAGEGVRVGVVSGPGQACSWGAVAVLIGCMWVCSGSNCTDKASCSSALDSTTLAITNIWARRALRPQQPQVGLTRLAGSSWTWPSTTPSNPRKRMKKSSTWKISLWATINTEDNRVLLRMDIKLYIGFYDGTSSRIYVLRILSETGGFKHFGSLNKSSDPVRSPWMQSWMPSPSRWAQGGCPFHHFVREKRYCLKSYQYRGPIAIV